jgi:hypothetical protein
MTMSTTHALINFVEDALVSAKAGESKLDSKTLAIRGYSPTHMRHFFNSLMSNGLNYIEAGSWCGATICAAACGNRIDATAIEDFSQFAEYGTDPNELRKNIEMTKPKCKSLKLVEASFWDCSPEDFGITDCFFYDGGHSRFEQGNALKHFLSCMNKDFVYIVDDTNWPEVQLGNTDGFKSLKDKVFVHRHWKKRTAANGSSDWNNGIDIYVCERL